MKSPLKMSLNKQLKSLNSKKNKYNSEIKKKKKKSDTIYDRLQINFTYMKSP